MTPAIEFQGVQKFFGNTEVIRGVDLAIAEGEIHAIIGPNGAGKSTLFNRLTKSRDAIVADFAGLTRDRHYGEGRLGPHAFIAIDTGGFEPECKSGIFKEMAKQTLSEQAARRRCPCRTSRGLGPGGREAPQQWPGG